jgi:rRNA processing protein Gar1
MDKIGTGFRTVGDKILVKLSILPETNQTVYTEEGIEVGRLVDIIGPAKAPFGVVSAKSPYEAQGKIITIKT